MSYKQIGGWASGIDWYLTCIKLKLWFWPTETLFLFLLAMVIWHQSWYWKFLGGYLVLFFLLNMFGFGVKSSVVRIHRFLLGNTRNIRPARLSARRFVRGR